MSGAMKCPRCNAPIRSAPDEAGFILCAQCGAKLRSRTTAVVKIQSASGQRRSLPEGPPTDIDSVLARLEAPVSPSATLPPGTPLKKIPRPEEKPQPGAATVPAVDALLEEIRAVRRIQEEILTLLRSQPQSQPQSTASGVTPLDDVFTGLEGDSLAPSEPVRSRKRKTVLLIDDDASERAAVVQALEHADVPVKTAVDGNGGLAAIAMEKPDVIILELGLGGSMAGKDVINMIKATMEWVDIPIVLYTRVSVADQKEARIEHGADEFVLKGPGGAQTLVNKVIALFRRG